MSHHHATVILFTNKGLGVTPLHQWFEAFRDDIAIVTERGLVDEFRHSFREVYGVDNYFDDDCFFAVANEAIAGRDRPVRALCYLVEVDVDRCGRLRDEHGIAGMSYADSLAFRNKFLMKQRVAGHIKTPRFRQVGDAQALKHFAAEVGYPLILKPLDKFASMAVNTIYSADQITPFTTLMLAEEFVQGKMVHVDGFMHEGRAFATSISMYKNGCLAFTEGQVLGSYQLDENSLLHQQVAAFTRATLQVMPRTSPCLFHLEVFIRPDGELLFCEIAARIGGGHIYDVLNATCGEDVVKLWLAAQMGLDWFDQLRPTNARRHGFLLVPPVNGVLAQIRQVEVPTYVRKAYLPQVAPMQYAHAAMSIDRVASFFVEGRNSAEVAARLDECEELIRRALVWES